MKLIIDIDENVYKAMKTTYLNSYPKFDGYDMCVMSKKVREGTPLQEELEEIKAEIKPLRYGSDTYKHAIDDVFEILDNRIAELKGENK